MKPCETHQQPNVRGPLAGISLGNLLGPSRKSVPVAVVQTKMHAKWEGKTQQTPRVSRQIWTGNVRRRRAPVGNKGPGGTSWPDGRIPRSLSIVRLSPSQRGTPGDGPALFFLCRAAAGSERAGVGMDFCPPSEASACVCRGNVQRTRGPRPRKLGSCERLQTPVVCVTYLTRTRSQGQSDMR